MNGQFVLKNNNKIFQFYGYFDTPNHARQYKFQI